MFDERRTAQMAAYFLSKAGGSLSHLKLMKLLYLADRESFARFEHPISHDHIVAMPHGPVLSTTLNLTNAAIESAPFGWEHWIGDRAGHVVSLRRGVDRDALEDLSDADVEVVDHVWGQFGHLSKWQLRDYTHEHCPEWTDPNGSSIPITWESIFMALGKPYEVAADLSMRLRDFDQIGRKLSVG